MHSVANESYLFDFAFEQCEIVAIFGRQTQRRLHFGRVLNDFLIQFAALFDEAFLVLVRFLERAMQLFVSEWSETTK